MNQEQGLNERLQEGIAVILDVDKAQIRHDVDLLDYGLDSLSLMQLILLLEHDYGVEISLEDVINLRTIEAIVSCVQAKRGQKVFHNY